MRLARFSYALSQDPKFAPGAGGSSSSFVVQEDEGAAAAPAHAAPCGLRTARRACRSGKHWPIPCINGFDWEGLPLRQLVRSDQRGRCSGAAAVAHLSARARATTRARPYGKAHRFGSLPDAPPAEVLAACRGRGGRVGWPRRAVRVRQAQSGCAASPRRSALCKRICWPHAGVAGTRAAARLSCSHP